MSLGICFFPLGEHISLVIFFFKVREDIPLGIMGFLGGRTHFARDMCFPGRRQATGNFQGWLKSLT